MTKTFIEFIEIQDSKKKTKTFYIRDNASNILGYVMYFTQWRKYTLMTEERSRVIFDENCIEEIIKFLKKSNDERKGE